MNIDHAQNSTFDCVLLPQATAADSNCSGIEALVKNMVSDNWNADIYRKIVIEKKLAIENQNFLAHTTPKKRQTQNPACSKIQFILHLDCSIGIHKEWF